MAGHARRCVTDEWPTVARTGDTQVATEIMEKPATDAQPADEQQRRDNLAAAFAAKGIVADPPPAKKADPIDDRTGGEVVDQPKLSEAHLAKAKGLGLTADDLEGLSPEVAGKIIDKATKRIDKIQGKLGQQQEELARRLAEAPPEEAGAEDEDEDEAVVGQEEAEADDKEEEAAEEKPVPAKGKPWLAIEFGPDDDFEEGESGRTGKLNAVVTGVNQMAKSMTRLMDQVNEISRRLEGVDVEDFFGSLDAASAAVYGKGTTDSLDPESPEWQARERSIALARKLQKAEAFSGNQIGLIDALKDVIDASPARHAADRAINNRKAKVEKYAKSGLRRPGTQTQDPSPRNENEKRMDNIRKAFAAKGLPV